MRAFLFNQKMTFLLYFLFLLSSFLNTFVSPTQNLCHPDQRDALIEFKAGLEIQKPTLDYSSEDSCYLKTESWVNTSDCCSWDGVTCDIKSGEVVGLNLSASCLQGRLESNSSLFRLRHLRDLNLAYNNFTASRVPVEFEKLKGLETLNLSRSSFSGQIPNKLLFLTKLVSLDLSQNSLSVDESFLHLLAQDLRNLRDLDMSLVNIPSEIPHEFSTMWSLRSLGFENCSLIGEFPSNVFLIPNLESIRLGMNPNLRGNLPIFRENNSLQILSLSSTSFSGIIPDSISNLKHLTYLKLSSSNFSGRFPSSIGNLSHLSYLSLSRNNFIGEIPFSIVNLKQLTVFVVSKNKLSGNFPSALLNSTQLRYVSLWDNEFTGLLPPNISQLSKLEYFDASSNFFVGAIPSSLFTISSLTEIYLDYNQINDLLGIKNIYLLPNLKELYLGHNNFMASPVDLNFFSPLKHLETLYLSGIPLSTSKITSDSDFQPHLVSLDLSGCNFTEFPHFIRNQRDLKYLHLSSNKIKGQVPDWLWKLPDLSRVYLSNNSLNGFEGPSGSKLEIFDISSNDFQGPLFIPSRSTRYYFASKNNFTGEIPQSICGVSSLVVLNLSNNNLYGSIPRCLKTLMGSFLDLKLRNNSFSGSIPDIFMNAKNLKSLDVSQNRFEGKLPSSLTGCYALEVLNVESNKIDDMFPFQLNSLPNLKVLVLRSNKFHGTLHKTGEVWVGFPELKIIDASHNGFFGNLPDDYFMNWTAVKRDKYTELEYIGVRIFFNYYVSLVLMSKGVSMQMERISKIETAIDFSGNQLRGPIPNSIGLLKELRMLNLSNNAFTGHIPSSLANLTNLESLDLSQNKISGRIPPALGSLSSLAWINISHNQLVGPIPQGTQFQRQNCSSYEGNPGLDGPSLRGVCGDKHALPPKQSDASESSEEEDEEWFSWRAAGFGIVPGVVLGLTLGYIVASYKHEWFMKTFGRNKHRSTRTR